MDPRQYNSPLEYLQSRGYAVAISANGSELRIKCPFCGHHNEKCYINNFTGLWHCFHCLEKGTWKFLLERFNDANAVVSLKEQEEKEEEILTPIDFEIIEEHHQELLKQKELLKWLKTEWGWNENTIIRGKLGWTRRFLTFPIIDSTGNYLNIKYRTDPTRTNSKGFYGLTGRNTPKIYNQQLLYTNPDYIIICEGEKDCLTLYQQGFNAVTSTGGVDSFKDEWLELFKDIPKVYICFDNDKYNDIRNVGGIAALELQEKFKVKNINVYIIQLPDPNYIEKKLDITNFFIDKKKKREDFQKLMADAQGIPLNEDEVGRFIVSFQDDNQILETVYTEDKKAPIKFCIYNFKTQKIEYKKSFDLNGERITPLSNSIALHVKLPSAAVFIDEDELDKQIITFLNKYCYIEEKNLFFTLLYIKLTWIFDSQTVVPYLRTSGMPGTGKTRFLDTIGALCYRSVILNGAISEAALFRIISICKPTLIINEFDRLNNDEKALFTIILNNGYEAGKPVPRVEGDKIREIVNYDVYSPKIFATIDRFKDSALESRIISLESKEFPTESRNRFPVILKKDFFNTAVSIRNALLGFRLKFFQNAGQDAGRVAGQIHEYEKTRPADLGSLRVSGSGLGVKNTKEEIFLNINEFDGRIRQTFYPLLSVLKEKDIGQFIEYVKEYQKQITRTRADELLGVIATAIIINYDTVLDVSIKILTEEVNKNVDKVQTPQSIGWHLKRLGIFTKEQGHDKIKYLILTEEKIEFLRRRYIINEEPIKNDGLSIENSQIPEPKQILLKETGKEEMTIWNPKI